MNWKFVLFCVWFFVASVFSATKQQEEFRSEFSWTFINYTWLSQSDYETAISTKSYIPEHNAMAGIKTYKDRIYIALPRVRPGAPVTLASISSSLENKTNALLSPFPSWDLNCKPSCATLQNVQSMEIDSEGVMWVLDGNRFNDYTTCPPKLVLLDLNNNGNVLKTFEFGKELCPAFGCFLNDLVVDEENGGFAYITEHSDVDPGIIVYSRKDGRAWKARDGSMFGEVDAANFTVDGVSNDNGLHNIDGIAIAPSTGEGSSRMVFYCSIAGFNLHGVSNLILRNETACRSSNWRYEVKLFGRKPSQSDGMIVDKQGNLYYGLLDSYGVGRWNIYEPFENAVVLQQDRENIIWPDSFMMDSNGTVSLLTNGINKFFNPSYPLEITEEIKFRIFKLAR